MPTIADLREALAAHPFRRGSEADKINAAVAVALHELPSGPQVLFIERAEYEGDPWSGHLAFPGGTAEEGDPDLRSTAERETLEEIGLDLRSAEYLGQLDDVTGSTLPVVVSGFVYSVERPGPFTLSSEIKEAFWVSVDDLSDATRQVKRRFQFGGLEHVVPAIDLLGPGRPVLWGLTYRFVVQILGLLGREIPCVPRPPTW